MKWDQSDLLKNPGTGFFIPALYVTDSLQRQPGAITWGGAEQSRKGNGMTYISAAFSQFPTIADSEYG